MQHGLLYLALRRLERRGWVPQRLDEAPDCNRKFKDHRLTEKGRMQLIVGESPWELMTEAVAREMRPVALGS
jgi:DNA-binding PadR family transcriptional regulator